MAKNEPIVHLREIFWRPDILAIHQVEGVANVTKCDQVLPSAQMTCDTRLVTCECCRRNFIEGLLTGDGTKLSWDEYHAQKQATTFPTLKEKAAAAEASELQWTTSGVPQQIGRAERPEGWTTVGTATPPAGDGWSTGGTQTGRWTSDTSNIEEIDKPPGDGWTTKR